MAFPLLDHRTGVFLMEYLSFRQVGHPMSADLVDKMFVTTDTLHRGPDSSVSSGLAKQTRISIQETPKIILTFI